MNDLKVLDPAGEERNCLSRRDFLGHCASMIQGITVIGIVAPIAAGCGDDGPTGGGNTETVTFDVSSLTADGQAVITNKTGSDTFRIMIVRVGEGDYRALSIRCTHESCEVPVPDSNGEIICPCHGSRYNIRGEVTNGPAAQNLKSYQLTYNANDETVSVTVT